LSVSGDSYIKTALTLDYEIFKKNHLNIAANFANVADNLYETTDWFSQVKYSGYALGYGLETIVGPIEFKYSCSPELNKGFAWFSVDSGSDAATTAFNSLMLLKIQYIWNH
jgi:NTE family protein